MALSLKSTALIIAASLLLAACGNASNSKPAPQTELPPLEATPAPAAVVEIPDPALEEAETVVTPEAEVAAVEPEPIIVDDDPLQFINLNIHELSKLLGAPLLVRRDGNAEVWQYKGEACTLDVFLYESQSQLRVKYVDLRGDFDVADNRACMAEILRQHIRHMS